MSRRRCRLSDSELDRLGLYHQPFKRPRITNSHSLGIDQLKETESGACYGNSIDDRISGLPDSIIHHILSLLPVDLAIKTSVLSKRWCYLWAEVPVLNFIFIYNRRQLDFGSLLCNVRRLYRGNKIQKLLMNLLYQKNFTSQIDDWIRFSTERNVEELSLDFLGAYYQLPQTIFSNSSIRILYTRFCDFMPIDQISWASLTVLSIGFTKLNNVIIAKILSGSPKLEFLKLERPKFEFLDLEYCKGQPSLCKITISSKNLKVLEIHSVNLTGLRGRAMVEISCPNVLSLSLSGHMYRMMFKLINLSSLVEVSLRFHSVCSVLLIELLRELNHVQKLNVADNLLEVLSTCEFKSLFACPLSKLRSLIIETSFNDCDLLGIPNLLQISPDLEKLTINMKPPSYPKELDLEQFELVAKYWESVERDLKFHYLKSIEITGFRQTFAGFNFKFFSLMVELLLKNAMGLEKMIIYEQSETASLISQKAIDSVSPYPSAFLREEVRKLVSNYPRASATEKVRKLLSYPRASAIEKVRKLFSSYPRASANVAVVFKTLSN